jgi:hypothetical protein
MPNTNTVEKTPGKTIPLLKQAAPEIKTAAAVLAGGWALKNFPKITIIGLVGVGILIGMTMKEVARSVDKFPRRSPQDLH